MVNPMDLTDKKVLVIGAVSDIGVYIVNQLLTLGANTVLIDRDEAQLQSSFSSYLGEKCSIFSFDYYINELIEPELSNILSITGKLDGYVYCAGHGILRPLSLTKVFHLQDMMTSNFYSFVEISRIITKRKHFNTGGSIVAISSVSSIKGLKSKLAYSASKAALDSGVRSLAAELSDRKIRVNSVLKGGLTIDNNLDHINNVNQITQDELINKQILGASDPIEIANLVAFLLSDAVKTMTGSSIVLDGGYSL